MQVRHLVVATGFLLALPCYAQAQVEDGPERGRLARIQRSIQVTGTGRVSAAPDEAEINIGVVSSEPTAADALAANSKAMTAVHAVLKEHGIAAKDIQTVNMNIQPRFTQPPQPRPGQPQPAETYVRKIEGYDVTNTVRITARDLSKLGAILDAVVQSGANQVHGISFQIHETEKLLDQARKHAVADARRKAEQLAGEAGVVLGLPITIAESSSMPAPMPVRGRAAPMAMAAPISAGEQELVVNVGVTYEVSRPR